MADETAPAEDAAATPAAAADEPPQVRLMMHSQFLQDLSFENPNGAASFTKGELKPQVQLNLNVDSRKLGESTHEVALKVTGDATNDGERCFLVEIDYRGVFSLTGTDENLIHPILMVEGPRTLFPFVRRIVADAVRDGGFPPLMMEPVDFVAIYRQRMAQQQAANQAKSEAAAADAPADETA